MRQPARWEKEAAKATSEVARRAIRRLDIFGWVMISAVMGLAIGGGLVVAALLASSIGLGFRTTWIVASLLLMIVPGSIGLARYRAEERRARASRRDRDADEDRGWLTRRN
jgi:enoyl-CoA hydratase/carnithine racemase